MVRSLNGSLTTEMFQGKIIIVGDDMDNITWIRSVLNADGIVFVRAASMSLQNKVYLTSSNHKTTLVVEEYIIPEGVYDESLRQLQINDEIKSHIDSVDEMIAITTDQNRSSRYYRYLTTPVRLLSSEIEGGVLSIPFKGINSIRKINTKNLFPYLVGMFEHDEIVYVSTLTQEDTKRVMLMDIHLKKGIIVPVVEER